MRLNQMEYLRGQGAGLELLQGLQPGTETPPFQVSVPAVKHPPQEMSPDFADEKC